MMDDLGKARQEQQAAAAGSAWLIHNGQRVDIDASPFLMGKYNTALQLNYAIRDNNRVSRSHATIFREQSGYMLRDNQSRNGTYLNGEPLVPMQPVPLKDQDEIRLYDEILTFHQE